MILPTETFQSFSGTRPVKLDHDNGAVAVVVVGCDNQPMLAIEAAGSF
jgi:hypothetical protein